MSNDASQFLKSKFLKVADLNGQPVPTRILGAESRELRDFSGSTSERLVVTIKGDWQWTPNQPAIRSLIQLLGSDMDQWVGQRVVLFPSRAGSFDCIGVKAYVPPQQPQRVAVADEVDA